MRRKANGHRWREVVRRVKAEETHCALCGEAVDFDLPHLDPMAASVDHAIPIHRGGAEYDRSNCRLMHRAHNRWKGTLTLDEALAKWHGRPLSRPAAPVEASDIW